ncbi:DUF4386 domain-containing protein [Simiduia agarivorans]|uniref:DUF4386 domain-containing protein n=1 Tax=Simiduia agarivorans (strain DSM 21679 / JCM 13881 / BCRC 17597 / SA1) TaxID=1117647 RepID=K4KMS6_SIMAS|nr:DUF4386 domain-containing protein [Simiduia agarivorans]AFV00322.1 hypothetical protein M5M_15945 [Simiduia agarivorans SA1 = DSM 21679]
MTLQQSGGVAAIIEGLTYIFGIVLFLIVLNPAGHDGAMARLQFMTENSDRYILGLLVSGFLFSFALVVLVQAIHQQLVVVAPDLTRFATVIGYFWAAVVLASAMIEMVSINALAELFITDPDAALALQRSAGVVSGGLGGDIELIGAVWTACISVICIKHNIFNRWLSYLGLMVGAAGTLTLLNFFSTFKGNPAVEWLTLIFGLGQIPWFFWLGLSLYRR